jgi:hypothetical protein
VSGGEGRGEGEEGRGGGGSDEGGGGEGEQPMSTSCEGWEGGCTTADCGFGGGGGEATSGVMGVRVRME